MRNIGAFRDIVTIYFESAVTKTDMGSRVQTFESFDEPADVKQISSGNALRLGLDTMTDSYNVICRPPDTWRPVKVVYDSETYRVVSAQRDKVSQYLELIVTKSQ